MARPALVDALQRRDVGVVTAARDEHVALGDCGAARGVERVPVARPGLEPRVALPFVGLADHPALVRVEIARRVPARDAGGAQHGQPDVHEVLAHTAPHAQHLGRRRRHARRAGLVFDPFPDAVTQAGEGRGGRGLAPEIGGEGADGVVGLRHLGGREVLDQSVSEARGVDRVPRDGLVEVGGALSRLDQRRPDDGELLVRMVEVERVHPASPVVAIAVQVRGRRHVDAVLERELVRGVGRRDARFVVRRVHVAEVPEAGRVPDLEPPRHRVRRSTR